MNNKENNKNFILVESDLAIFRILSKYRITKTKQLATILNRHYVSMVRRIKQLELAGYVRREEFYNREKIIVAKAKALKEVNDFSKPYKYNPLNRANSYHELKVLDCAIFLSKKFDLNILNFQTHRDMWTKGDYNTPDLKFEKDGKIYLSEIELTPKTSKRLIEKFNSPIMSKYEKVIFFVSIRNQKMIETLKDSFLTAHIEIYEIDSYEYLGNNEF